jgi:hypothetical protein
VIRFPNDKHFEVVDMVQREREGTAGTEWDTFRSLVPTIHGTSFRVSEKLQIEYPMSGKLKERENKRTDTQTTWQSHSSYFLSLGKASRPIKSADLKRGDHKSCVYT